MLEESSGPVMGGATNPHPYKTGNFTPIREERILERCEWTGDIPEELVGG
jgi:carotenoid cleavage dioxygenase-like enzyme